MHRKKVLKAMGIALPSGNTTQRNPLMLSEGGPNVEEMKIRILLSNDELEEENKNFANY